MSKAEDAVRRLALIGIALLAFLVAEVGFAFAWLVGWLPI